MLERMYALDFEIADDGTVNLEQDGGGGEVDRISLHPAQLRLLCERAGLLATNTSPVIGKRILARFGRLLTDVAYLADEVWLDEICERLGDGLAFRIAMVNAADELRDLVETLEDAHASVPRDNCGTGTDELRTDCGQEASAAAACHERPDANSVTKRGRKPIGDKEMTDAERQRKHRDGQAGDTDSLFPATQGSSSTGDQ